MNPWLAVVGIGEDGLDGLSAKARARVADAEVLVGGERHLGLIAPDGRERIAWSQPLTRVLDEIVRRRGRRVCVLASGDPMHYGVGARLARLLAPDEMVVVPGVSAFAWACAHMGWDRALIQTLTLHGRPLETLHAYVQPGARLLALSEDGATPAAVAALLVARGFGASRMTALERLGGPRERRIDATAADWPAGRIDDLNTLAIECVGAPEAVPLPRTPGLADEAFLHDGRITKREVRAVTLAALMPLPGQRLWDVGAGAGSVAIEWMRADPSCQAVAVERDPARAGRCRENARRLGVPGLAVVEGEAPAALAGLDSPDAVFVGGGLSAPGLVTRCWQALRAGGRLVANAVTIEGEQTLAHCHRAVGGSLVRLEIAHAEPLGERLGWRPARPVVQLSAIKR